MDGHRLGAVLRTVRIRRGWRQMDVARAAAVSDQTVSRMERGRLNDTTLGTVARVAAALDVRVDLVPRWHGGDLDRALGAGHARMHEVTARWLKDAGWLVAPEVSFSVYGERGVIDVLALHEGRGMLLVVELKTAVVDVQGLLGAIDRYRRLAPGIASERGWHAEAVSLAVLVREGRTNRRRVADHVTVLRAALPADGRALRSWVRDPRDELRCLAFLPDRPGMSGIAGSAGRQRVRRRGPSVSPDSKPAVSTPRVGSAKKNAADVS